MKVFKVICTLFIFGFVSVSHAAVIFITEKDGNGVTTLLGADNVEVSGEFYNVRFQDLNYTPLWDGVMEGHIFDGIGEYEAAKALEEQVFRSIYGGYEDDFSVGIMGCASSVMCYVLDGKYNDQAGKAGRDGYGWHVIIDGDMVGYSQVMVNTYNGWGLQIFNEPLATFAVWETVVVSAPGTAMVLLMGIAGLIVSQRRKQA